MLHTMISTTNVFTLKALDAELNGRVEDDVTRTRAYVPPPHDHPETRTTA